VKASSALAEEDGTARVKLDCDGHDDQQGQQKEKGQGCDREIDGALAGVRERQLLGG